MSDDFPSSSWDDGLAGPVGSAVDPVDETSQDVLRKEILYDFLDAHDLIIREDGSQNQHHPHMSGATFAGTQTYWRDKLAEALEAVDGLGPQWVSWEDKLWVEVTRTLTLHMWTERRIGLLRIAGVIMAEILDGDAHPEKETTEEEQAQIDAAENLRAPEYDDTFHRPPLTQVSNDDGENAGQ